VAGGGAGVALVLLRARRPAHGSSSGGLSGARKSAERTVRDLGRETRKLLGDR
jgi:hypothetical protein